MAIRERRAAQLLAGSAVFTPRNGHQIDRAGKIGAHRTLVRWYIRRSHRTRSAGAGSGA